MGQPSAMEPRGAMRWYALAVFTLGYALNIGDRYVVSTLIEPIKAEMGLSDSAVGFLTGVSLAIFYVTIGIPLAVIADRSNRRNLLAASVAVWSAMTALCGQAQSFLQLMFARFGVGVGEAGGTPPSASLIADMFGPLQRSLAFSIFALGAPLGAWLGSEFAGNVAEQYGWRAAFTVLGLPGIVLALVILLTLREPVRGRLDGGSPSNAAPRSFKETLRYLWHKSSVFHVIAGGTLLTLWSWGLIWWTPAFLMRSHGLTVGEAGGLLGPIHLVGGTGSLVVTAALMYLPAFRDPRRIMRFVAFVALVATIPSILVYAGDRSLVVPMLWILIPATYFYLGPITGVLQNLVPSGMRAQAMAILLFTANVANLVIAPQLLGFASDVLTMTTELGADSLRWVLACTAPAGFWAAWHCWRAGTTVREDYQAVIGGGGRS